MRNTLAIGQLRLKCAGFVGATYEISRHLSEKCPVTKKDSKMIVQAAVIFPSTLVYAAAVIKPKSIGRIFRRYFLSHPNDFRFLPLLGCGFAHGGILHLGANMFAYNSFAEPFSQAGGPYLTLWIFTTGVVGGSFLSCVFRSLRGMKAASLGASGGVAALAAMLAFIVPEAKYGLIFLPSFFSFEA